SHRTANRTVVIVVPLGTQVRVVERRLQRSLHTVHHRFIHHFGRDTTTVVRREDTIQRSYVRHTLQRCHILLCTRYGNILVKAHVVPEMESIPTAAFGEPASVAEAAPYLSSTERSRYPVEVGIAR